ncbi:hypothetical protein G5I_12421 [Acromyrmex echinatior]|uniref:Uncharacterized protein n=1 Tax=Acromyrmex echinatior TaxID=103372 RepID=F4X299_ACREC|nr:hypothetical protein G5I_12421 [Acromyrmex echinatior]
MSASVTKKFERKKRSWDYWEISGNGGATLRLMFIITPLLHIVPLYSPFTKLSSLHLSQCVPSQVLVVLEVLEESGSEGAGRKYPPGLKLDHD